jgi:hypothetical protein
MKILQLKNIDFPRINDSFCVTLQLHTEMMITRNGQFK